MKLTKGESKSLCGEGGLWQSRGWLGGDCTSPGEESIPPALKAGSWERNGFMDDLVQGRVREITDAEGL